MGAEYVHRARDRKVGMTTDEVMEGIVRARSAGFTTLVKTEVGFRGQIQVMRYREPSEFVPRAAELNPVSHVRLVGGGDSLDIGYGRRV